MRRLALLLAATALTAVPMPADAAGCAGVTDPAGDAVAMDVVPVPAETHVDLRQADVALVKSRLVVTITGAGLDPQRLGEWRLELSAGGQRLLVGAGLGMWVNAGDWHGLGGYVAGPAGGPLRSVRGKVDYAADTITVDAPLSAFGRVRLARGTALSDLVLSSRETFVNLPGAVPTHTVHVGDTATAPGLVLGSC